MENKTFLDFKYSLFGDFTKTQDAINDFVLVLGTGYTRNFENEIVAQNVVKPVFTFADNYKIIRLSSSRLDYIPKINHDNCLQDFLTFIGQIKNTLPTITRLAINSTFFVDKGNVGTHKPVNEELFQGRFSSIKEFFNRTNFESKFKGLFFNNILSYGPDEVVNRDSFIKLKVILFSIDINNIPLQSSSDIIGLDSLAEFFNYMSDNMKAFDAYIERRLFDNGK
ncbi:MAG: hypothetical protein K5906_04410 [Bacilli bacterium]|nr:hypothetical protein [Bacilli bacterium]